MARWGAGFTNRRNRVRWWGPLSLLQQAQNAAGATSSTVSVEAGGTQVVAATPLPPIINIKVK